MATQLTSPTRPGFPWFSAVGAILWTFAVLAAAGAERSGTDDTAVYSYTLAHEATTASYDESMVVACLQGIVNRDCPRVYVLSRKDNRPEHWRKILSGKGRWLEGKTFEPLADLAALVELARPQLKGAVIWDPEVPTSINVATTIAPMVLDWDEPSADVKDAFTQFSPDGFATIVMDLHETGGRSPDPHLWKGMPVVNLINSTCNYSNPEQTADAMYASLKQKPVDAPGFFFFRIVWVGPSEVIQSMETLREKHPELEVELVDPYSFFRLFKVSLLATWLEQRAPRHEKSRCQ